MDAQLCAVSPGIVATEVCAAAANNAATLPADVRAVEDSLNQFALDLYQTITDSNSTKPVDEGRELFNGDEVLV